MNQTDRELLALLSTVNQHVGEIVLRLLNDGHDNAELTTSDLRSVGNALASLGNELTHVGNDMTRQADEMDGIAQTRALGRQTGGDQSDNYSAGKKAVFPGTVVGNDAT